MACVLKILGTIFFSIGTVQFFTANMNLGVILTGVSGLFLLLWGIFYCKVQKLTQKGVLKGIKYAIIFMICVEILLIGFIAYHGQADTASYTEDAVIVLGAGIHGDKVSSALKLRLDEAVVYYRKNPDAIIVVTGGMGHGESVTEAYAMEKYLIQKGVPADRILKEEAATSTNENMRFSKEILDARFGKEYRTVVITNDFHMYRALAIAEKEGIINPKSQHAGLQWYNLLPCYLRESLAVLKMWFFN